MRNDLLLLTPDDLAALTNRGTVKRAQRELDENEATGTISETEQGDVAITWSDGPKCSIPAGVALLQGRCDCSATSLCRHLIRMVLLYQKTHTTTLTSAPVDAPNTAVVPHTPSHPSWDPGSISDEVLNTHFRPANMSRIRSQFNQGVLAEVVRSAKPMVRFHQPAAVVRFLVPGDPRYTHCDCAQPAPCAHVPLAVWVARQLPAHEVSGIVSTTGKSPPVPETLLAEVHACIADLLEVGFNGVQQAWADRLMRCEASVRTQGLTWPADVLAELIEQYQRYAKQDALFAPDRSIELIGELMIRCDAIAHDTGALPQPLIRGTGLSREAKLGACRLIGLGCGVIVGQREAELVVYLQDDDTGTMAIITREFADPDLKSTKQEARPFAELARFSMPKLNTLFALGAGQILTDGGRRTAAGRFTLGRVHATSQAQNFAWESLKAPVFVEDYAELAARLRVLPPSAIRPRRAAEDFHVIPVAAVSAAGFDVPTQSVRALLADATGATIALVHPFTERARSGTEALLAHLHDAECVLKFVSGTVRQSGRGLVIAPVCCVLEKAGKRFAVQPWIEPHSGKTNELPSEISQQSNGLHPIAEVLHQCQLLLEDALLRGVRRLDPDDGKRWHDLQRQAESVGLVQVAHAMHMFIEPLERKFHTLHWDVQPTVQQLLKIMVLVRLAHDVGWNVEAHSFG